MAAKTKAVYLNGIVVKRDGKTYTPDDDIPLKLPVKVADSLLVEGKAVLPPSAENLSVGVNVSGATE